MSLDVDVTAERTPAALGAGTTQSRRLATFSVLAALAVIAWHAQTKPLFRLDFQTAGFILALVVLLRPFPGSLSCRWRPWKLSPSSSYFL